MLKRRLSPALTALATLATLPDGSVQRADADPVMPSDERRTLVRITAHPQRVPESRHYTPEQRAELKASRKERRARRMRLRKHRGFR